MFEYFYHEILRRTVIGFGTLFNDINIRHTDSTDNTVSELKVPLAYGPTQKFLARLEQVADLNKPTQLSLPRMSFEMIGLSYDPARKVTSTQTFISALESDKKKARKTFMPVPYNMAFELSVYTKLNDDMLQIVEQNFPILPTSYNLTIDLVDQIGEKRDIPVVFEGITMSDDYEGNYQTRRSLVYTLRFTAKVLSVWSYFRSIQRYYQEGYCWIYCRRKNSNSIKRIYIFYSYNQEQRRVMQIM